MKAKLIGMWVDSATIDLETYVPENDQNFWLTITLQIGADGVIGGNNFTIYVCTPRALEGEIRYGNEGKAIWGRHMLIVLTYDLDLIKSKIHAYIDNCTGNSWEDIAMKLSRVAAWEFEDYKS